MRLLAAGVPLSLLLDLAPVTGPDSRAILRVEQAMQGRDRTARAAG